MRIFLAAVALVLALLVLRLTFARSDAIETDTDVVRTERGAEGSVEPGPRGAGQSAPLLVDPVVEPSIESARVVLSDSPLAVEFPAGRAMLTIRVMSGAKPIAGSAVVLDPVVAPEFVGELDAEGVARTDAGGRARFHLRPSRMVAVCATLPGTDWSATGTFTTPFEGREREVTLRIANAEQMEGTLEILVRSFPSLEPLAGVSLRANARTGRALSLETERTTDEHGRLEVPWQHGLEYVAMADGHSQATVRAPVRLGDGPLIIDLPKHARVWGTFAPSVAFQSENGEPPGSIQLTPLVDSTGRGTVTTMLDPSGNWAIEDIAFPFGKEPSCVFSVDGSLEGSSHVFVREFTLHAGDDLELRDEWKTAPGFDVEVHYGSGQPVGPAVTFVLIGASVSVGRGPRTSAAQTLDSDGRATFAHIPMATWPFELRPFKDRHTAFEGLRPAFEGSIVHDGAGFHRIVVDGFESISGRVVDAAGAGQANWYVRLVESSPDRASRLLMVRADGSFRFDFVHVGASLSVEVGRLEETSEPAEWLRAKEMKFVPARETTATPGEHGIQIVVEPR